MLQIIYASTARKGLTPPDIEAILEKARTRNAAAQITGMLLYADNNFLQVLEGPEAAVEHVFTAIQNDPRHTGLLPLIRRKVDDRNFQNWSMGFERVERAKHPNLKAVFDIDRTAIENRLTAAEADQIMAFLGTFYTVTTRQKL